MKINAAGLKLVKEFEGLYLRAYRDAVGVWTIGYGITNADKAITGTTIKSGLTITRATAESWLEKSLNKKYMPMVMKYDSKYDWNENEASALCSFAYNIGSIDGLTAKGTRSRATIRKKILEYDKAGGRTLAGLTRRRKAELALFNKAVTKSHYKGTYPTLPERGYFQIGDGYKTLKDWQTQIKRVQAVTAWATGTTIKQDGKYGESTAAAVKKLQKAAGTEQNGKFGKLCLAYCKKVKK